MHLFFIANATLIYMKVPVLLRFLCRASSNGRREWVELKVSKMGGMETVREPFMVEIETELANIVSPHRSRKHKVIYIHGSAEIIYNLEEQKKESDVRDLNYRKQGLFTPLESAMPMCPTKGRNQVIGGMAVQTMQ